MEGKIENTVKWGKTKKKQRLWWKLLYARIKRRIAGAHYVERFGIIGAKRPFEPNIIKI